MLHFRNKFFMFFAGLIASTTIATGPLSADIIVEFSQVGADVVATATGSVNTTGLTLATTSTGFNTRIWSAQGRYRVGLTNTNSDLYSGPGSGISAPGAFGTGSTPLAPSSGVGGIVGGDEFGNIWLPAGYISNTALPTTTATWNNTSFADMGVVAGTSFSWTWGTGPTADAITVNFTTAAVPEPSSFAVLGLGAIGAIRYKRRKREQVV